MDRIENFKKVLSINGVYSFIGENNYRRSTVDCNHVDIRHVKDGYVVKIRAVKDNGESNRYTFSKMPMESTVTINSLGAVVSEYGGKSYHFRECQNFYIKDINSGKISRQERGWHWITPLLCDKEITHMFPIFQYMWEDTKP